MSIIVGIMPYRNSTVVLCITLPYFHHLKFVIHNSIGMDDTSLRQITISRKDNVSSHHLTRTLCNDNAILDTNLQAFMTIHKRVSRVLLTMML
jgi:hypothetical protein